MNMQEGATMKSDDLLHSSSAIRQMEMNPGTKKIYFVETKKGSKLKSNTEKPTASLSIKTGVLSLGTGAVRTLGIANQFYKVYHDAGNKIIGFQIKSKLTNGDGKSGWRLAQPSKASGMLPMSVRPALNTMMGLKEKYKKLEVKRYKDHTSHLDNETYYYVELK